MAVPKYNELMPSVIRCLGDGKIHALVELSAYCANDFKLTEEERNQIMSNGQNTLKYRVNWTNTYLKKAGLVESPQKGQYRLTETGKKAYKQGAEKVDFEYLNQFESFRNFRDSSSRGAATDTSGQVSDESPLERMNSAYDELNEELIDDLTTEIMKLSPYDFERLVVKLLVAMGYGRPEENKDAVTPKSGDEGIDGIVRADKLGFDSIYIQAKQWNAEHPVGRPDIQKFIGALATTQGATKGLFITTSDFAKPALEIVTKHTQNKIVLINGRKLAELMIEYNLGVSTIATYNIKRIDSDFFNEDI